MYTNRAIAILLLTVCTAGASERNITYQYGEYSKEIEVIVDNSREYIISFPPAPNNVPSRVSARTSMSWKKVPALIVVRQERQVLSWQIPMLIKTYRGKVFLANTSRTLCYEPQDSRKNYSQFSSREDSRSFSVSISTSSKVPINVIIEASEVYDFEIKDNINYTIDVSPSEPAFFYYSFKDGTNKSTAFISIDSLDNICLTVSVQDSLCPVRDLNEEISFEGKYLTMNTKGGLRISKKEFPTGFFLVFVAQGDNYQCTQESVILQNPRRKWKNLIHQDRTTTLHFKVKTGSTRDLYVQSILIIFGVFLGFCVIVMALVALTYRFGKLRKISEEEQGENEDDVDFPPVEGRECFRKEEIKLIDLDRYETRNQTKSFNYLWHILNIGLFYGIPVVQLMASYQKAVQLTGDQDICYHNLYCAHPLANVSDFNHIYSNIGYVMVGLLFLGIVGFRQKLVKIRKEYGIPQNYGLFYSMGIALLIEGVLSACYHICPNQSNYQFDTSFMYVMAVLVSVKLYQNRHPDINASAYSTFAVLGIAVLIAMFGILKPSTAIIIIFILCYLSLCIYLSFKLYFFGKVVGGLKNLYDELNDGKSFLEAVKPLHTGHFVILILANICNCAMAGIGIYLYPTKTDFGTYLLSILLGNAILHATFYIVMKICKKERICWEARLYGILALATWASASYFFFDVSTQWEATPAESKQLNNECLILGFYDQHDIWHMLSAPALLFSFMLLICIDDDLADKLKKEIEVF